MTMPLPQYYHVQSAQAAAPTVNEWWQRVYAYAYWQAYAHGWQAYAQWLENTQWERTLQATPSSPSNDNSATKVETPTRKRNRKPTLRSDIEDVKRAGLPIRSIQRTANGHFIHIGEPIINTARDNDNRNDGVSSDPNWH